MSKISSRLLRSLLIAGILLLFAGSTTVQAAILYTFESYTASAGGTSIAGQDGWYTPLLASTVDGSVFPYLGNTPGFVANPTGGNQFAGMVSQGPTGLARAQHDVNFGTSTLWNVGYDFAGVNLNVESTTDNLGSFSVGPEQFTFVGVAQWAGTSPASPYRFYFYRYDAAGTQTFYYPGGAWDGLAQNHWYRMGAVLDTSLNRVLSLSITDLETMTTNSNSYTDWYMAGGAVGPFTATSIRLFGGGAVAGNVYAFDNVTLEDAIPEPGTIGLLAGGLTIFALLRRRLA